MEKLKEKDGLIPIDRLICYFCYILVFINFMGVDFLKFKIAGINMNVGRLLMCFSIIPLIMYIRKERTKANDKRRKQSCITYNYFPNNMGYFFFIYVYSFKRYI